VKQCSVRRSAVEGGGRDSEFASAEVPSSKGQRKALVGGIMLFAATCASVALFTTVTLDGWKRLQLGLCDDAGCTPPAWELYGGLTFVLSLAGLAGARFLGIDWELGWRPLRKQHNIDVPAQPDTADQTEPIAAATRTSCLPRPASGCSNVYRSMPSPSVTAAGSKEHVLLEDESSGFFVGYSQPITTVTYFKGTPPARAIKQRVSSIIRANPWLAGSVAWNADRSRVLLRYGGPAANIDFARHYLELPHGALPVYADMPPQELCTVLDGCSAVVNSNGECLERGSDVVLFKVAVVPDYKVPFEGFALVISMSHFLGDGHTYYTLVDMLSNEGTVRPLRPERKEQYMQELEDAVGKVPKLGGPSAENRGAFFLNFLCTALLSRMTMSTYHVDDAILAKAKAQAQGVSFLSSNDILTSAFVKMMNADILLMPANLRGRLPCLAWSDAGNYFTSLSYTGEQASSASNLRRSLAHGLASYTRKDDLGAFRIMRSRIVAVTNWSSSAKTLVLDGCRHHFHQPVVDIKRLPLQGGIIFRSNYNKLSMMLVTDVQHNCSASAFEEAMCA